MRQVSGQATIIDPDQPLIERDTITCFHCQRIIFIKPHTASTVYLIFDRQAWTWHEEAGAFCRVCMHPICLPCCTHGRCTPFEKRLEQMEAKERALRSYGV